VTLPQLRFGAGDGANVDLDRLYESRLLIQGVSGSGKSTLIRSLLEQTHGKVPQFVIDSEGDFVTLREKYDYVLVGRGGDVPLSAKTAKITIRRLAELHVSAIFDLSELRFPERREWVRVACEELVHLPRTLWHSRIVVLDEAHIYCPERGSGDAVSTAAVIDVGTLGRKRGLCMVAATQRLSKLHKDLAGELLNKLIGYTDDVDLQRAGDQLGMTKEQRTGLKLLETHTFYGYGPAISRAPVLVQTLMPATKPPPRGQDRPAAPPARDKVKKILAQLVDLPKEAEEEAKSIEDFRRRNAELERRIRSAEKGMATKTIEKPVVDQAAIDRAVARAIAAEHKRFQPKIVRLQKLSTAVTEIPAAIGELASLFVVPVSVATYPSKTPRTETGVTPGWERPAPEARPRPARSVSATYDEIGEYVSIAPGEQKILDALAELKQLGVLSATRPQAGAMAGYNLSGGSGSRHVSSMVEKGLISIPEPRTIALTPLGEKHAQRPESFMTLADLHDRALSKLSGGERKVLEYLLKIYPDSVSRSQAGAAVSYNLSGGSGSRYVAKLATRQFVEFPEGRMLRAGKVLFPEGLR
jgi:energy-coupling factor transporter ATP-binding protein EcfA2